MTKGKFRVLVTVLAVAAAVAAVIATTAYGGAKAKPVIVDGTTDTVVNIDPANEYDYGSFTVDLNDLPGALRLPARREARSRCSRRGASHSTNLKTWTCKLRHDVKFSNGDPMTSADVKYSFDRVQAIKGDQGIYTLLSNLTSTTTSGAVHGRLPPEAARSRPGRSSSRRTPATSSTSNTFPSNKILANTDTRT